MTARLKSIQSLLYRLITAPSGVAEGLALERSLPAGGLASMIRGDDRLSAEQRVDIYANMYFYRLLGVMNEDYPATAAVLEETNFHNLITGYLLAYPPAEPSVAGAGRYLADFLRAHPLRAEFPFVADLAALERATIEVFCAADAPILEASQMNKIPPDRWAAVKMRRVPATAILEVQWKVEEVLRAVEGKRRWIEPPRHEHRILVWRRNSRVNYREIAGGEAEALAVLRRTVSFGRVCEKLAQDLSDEAAAAEISRTLARWLADGILMRPAARPPEF